MLSKIKSKTVPEAHSNMSQPQQQQQQQQQQQVTSDNEDNEIDTSDTNNNNNNNSDINNKNQQGKKSQEELLDIVEVSRKRRLSKDSADSLTSFIRWSFSHIESASIDAILGGNSPENSVGGPTTTTLDDGMIDEDDAWQHQQALANQRFQVPGQQEQLLMRAKFSSGGGGVGGSSGASSASNLALLKGANMGTNLGSLLGAGSEMGARGAKRARTHTYSPDSNSSKFNLSNQLGGVRNGSPGRKSSSYLGNVVERLHQQQHQTVRQHELDHHHHHHHQSPEVGSNSAAVAATAGLSFNLQQFLQQQSSLEDLCSSVGLDDSNNQLVLAAAIHRALVDSVGPGGQQLGGGDAKSVASSTGSSSGASSGPSHNHSHNHHQQLSHHTNNNNNNHHSHQHHRSLTNPNTNHHHHQQQQLHLASAGANTMHLVDSLSRQRRAYNTRAALHGIAAPTGNSNSSTSSSAAAATAAAAAAAAAAMSMSNRMQQQRHAQAAAALSALASAGPHSLHLAASAVAGTPTTPIVDFKCDTCPSSFDDRHRLMQHQSIHLELKKDWFTETPVDEVMKIFNRRRGEFLCNICNLRFEATLDYDQHNHSVHGPRPYCCQFCGNGTRTFKCWRQYLNHLYDHRYIFSCTIDDCDFTVNRRDSLRFHIFRFHLNCQLPQNGADGHNHHHHHQQQQHPPLPFGRVATSGAGNGGSKWPAIDDMEEQERVDDEDERDCDREHRDEGCDDVVDDEDDNHDDDDDDTENEMNVAD